MVPTAVPAPGGPIARGGRFGGRLEAYDDHALFRAIEAGVQGYLFKNLEAPHLRSVIEGVARGEPAIAPATAARIIDEFLRTPGGHPKATGRLTDRELEVLQLVTAGLRNRDIGTELGITENTVKLHLKNIADKLHAQHRADLAARAVREGLMPDESRDFVSYERPHRDSPLRYR
jgi:DNA-binding NarL/FixJ family response regulator